MTPAQVRGVVAAVQRDRRKWSIHEAWHAEAFQRTKRLKPLGEIIGEQRYTPRAKQSAKSMMGTLKAMAKEQRRQHERRQAKQEKADG